MGSDHEYEPALNHSCGHWQGEAGMRLTKVFAVGEKSLLCTESRCPAKRRTLLPDCREMERAAQEPVVLYQALPGGRVQAGNHHAGRRSTGGHGCRQHITSDPGPLFSYLYLPENDPPVPAT